MGSGATGAERRGAGAGARLASASPVVRTALAAGVVVLVYGMAALRPVFLAQPPADEVTWVERSLAPRAERGARLEEEMRRGNKYSGEYYWSIHHPTLARDLYGAALAVTGRTAPPGVGYDYELSYTENMLRGNRIVHRQREVLRMTNGIAVLAAVLILFAGLVKAIGSRALAAVAVMPIILEPTVTGCFNGTVGYIGTDALLMLMLSAFWLGWLLTAKRPRAAVVVLGILGGLATSTKYNGAFALVGALVWSAATARGANRLLRPAAMGAIAVGVFVALNPVYHGALARAQRVFADTLVVFSTMQRAAMGNPGYAGVTAWERVEMLLPYLPLALPLAALLARARRAWWFAPTALWSAPIIALNAAGPTVFLPTYAAPVRVAFLVLAGACGGYVARMWIERRTAATVRAEPAAPATASPADPEAVMP